MTLQERLNAVVTDLRACDNEDRVYALLLTEGAYGWPCDPCRCPLAVFIKERTGAEKVSVAAHRFEVWAPGEYAQAVPPAVVGLFLARFDNHGFEDLEEPGSTCTDEGCRLCFPEVSAA